MKTRTANAAAVKSEAQATAALIRAHAKVEKAVIDQAINRMTWNHKADPADAREAILVELKALPDIDDELVSQYDEEYVERYK